MKKTASALAVSLALSSLLVACGGGSDDPALKQGVFVDAPVAGMTYTGSTGVSGVTDSNGAFRYAEGSTVTFSLGGVTLPPVTPSAMVTPLDLVGASAPDHPGAVAIARLMQSLDTDDNPDNGIIIDKSKLASTAKAPDDWSKVDDNGLGDLLKDRAKLRDEKMAREHLTKELAKRSTEPKMSLVGRYTSGGTVEVPSAVAEITAYHANSKSLFITVDTATEPTSFKRIDFASLGTSPLQNPITANNLSVSERYNVASDVNDANFTAGGVQSLDVHGNLLAIAVQNTPKTAAGVIAFYSLSSDGTPTFLKKVSVGALPDGVAFSPDGKYLVVANEGELSNSFMTDGIDPDGSISVITITAGIPANTATTLGFSDFNDVNGVRSTALPEGVRIGRPGATVAQDLEPEYVSISADSKFAYVTMQENNAVAVVDLVTSKISKILPLGYKDYGSQYKIAASDKYATDPKTPAPLKHYRNLYGIYSPDGIASFTVGGKTYFITANEGDDRGDFLTGTSADTARFSELVTPKKSQPPYKLDPTAFPGDEYVKLVNTDLELGRLTLLTTDAYGYFGDTDRDGDFDRIFVLGGRSFSIWSADTGKQVYDSGEDFERIVYNNAADDATNGPTLLKAPGLLGRLDNKGPEPESVVVGQVGTELYAFIGLERSSGIMMYKITDPTKPKFVQYLRNTNNLSDGDISPEGVKFIPADKSPTGVPLLVVGYEVTGSVAVFQIN